MNNEIMNEVILRNMYDCYGRILDFLALNIFIMCILCISWTMDGSIYTLHVKEK